MTQTPAPQFELSDLEGRTWTLEGARGRPVLLLFLRHVY